MIDLRSVPLFSGLGDEALADLHGRLKLRRYRKGELVVREGALGDAMYILRSGQVAVVAEGRGDEPETLITHLGPGAPFGEQALLLGERRSASVRVVIDAEVWELSKADLEALFHEYPSIGLSFSRELARRVARTTRQPTERDETNLLAVLGSETGALASHLARITGQRIMLLDLGGLRPAHPRVDSLVTIEPLDPRSPPEALATRLGQLIGQFGRILMAIPRHENALTRKAAEQAEVIIEMGGRATPWVRRFARDGTYWYHPAGNGSVPQVARRIARRRVGLALSSGSAWSIAHIGVLQVLERERFPIDMISGASGGALFGALYAIGTPLSTIATFARDLPRLYSPRGGLADFNVPFRTGIVRGSRLQRFLDKLVGGKTFADTLIPLRIVCCDVMSGEEVVFDSGPLAEALRATISAVPILEPAFVGGRWLIDGAAVNPVPTSVLRDQVDILIASSAIASLDERRSRKELRKSGRLPGLFALTLGKEGIMEAGIIASKLGRVDALIQPDVAHFEASDFHRADDFIAAGVEAAEGVIPALKSALLPQPQRQFR